MPPRHVFLSHAGADTAAARVVAQRLRNAGVEVWFDKADLMPGTQGWQAQLEAAIATVTAFAVYVGGGGIVNWVDAEVRLALSRAISGGAPFPFVPILSREARSATLPPFARQFQAVRDVENDDAEWQRLLTAIQGEGSEPPLEAEPFFGLSAIDAARSHLFFGRKQETRQIVERLAERNLVLVSGDSGSGKSSLVLAGLVPAWCGNGIGLLRQEAPEDHDWHVVVTQPRRNPRRVLAERVADAARRLGLSADDCRSYAADAEAGNASQVRRALRCGLDSARTRTLLVVDQFEELVHPQTTGDVQEDFAKLLGDLADPDDPSVAVALTMRSDYRNLLRKPQLAPLYERLEANGRRARYMLGRIGSDTQTDQRERDGLRAVVIRPLRLAGRKEDEAARLADLVLADVGDRPGDLALVQFALTRAWKERGAHGDDLLRSYAAIGRVEGALAATAEQVFKSQLGGEARETVVAAALIRLGALTGTGTTRRLARRAEFSNEGWEVIQRLASSDGNRLVLINGEEGSETCEIAHEALLTQWERLDAWLRADEADKRSLDALADRVAAWQQEEAAPSTGTDAAAAEVKGLPGVRPLRHSRLWLQEGELRRFQGLLDRRPGWLTGAEADLVRHSAAAVEDAAWWETFRRRLLIGGVSVLGLLLMLAGGAWLRSVKSEEEAKHSLDTAIAALAGGIWSDLPRESGYLDVRAGVALWRLALAPEPVRLAFGAGFRDERDAKRIVIAGGEPLLRALSPTGVVTVEAIGAARILLDRLRAATDLSEVPALAQTLSSLAAGPFGKAGAPLAADGARHVLDRMRGPTADPFEASHLVQALSSLAGALGAEGAPLAAEGSRLMLLRGATDPFAAGLLGQDLSSLASLLAATDAQRAAEVARLVPDLLREATDAVSAGFLGQVLSSLAGPLGTTGAPLAADGAHLLLDRLRGAANPFEAGVLGKPLSALAGSLGAAGVPLAAEGARLVLDRLRRPTDSFFDALALAEAISSLADPLGAAGAPLVFEGARLLLDRPRRLTVLNETGDLARALSSLCKALAAMDVRLAAEFAHRLLDRLSETTDSFEAGALAEALPPLAGALAITHAPRAAELARRVLDRLQVATNPVETSALGSVLSSLAAPLTSTDARQAADGARLMLDRLREATTPAEEARAIAENLPSLAALGGAGEPTLTAGLRQAVLSGLAWSGASGEATAWAWALAGLVAAEANVDALRPLADAVRYPMAGGAPTAVLLAALKARDPRAPGAEAGLRANLDWLQRDHPGTQPFAPITCPPPPPWAAGADCPARLTESTQDFWAWFADKTKALLLRWRQ
ncbi:MAG: TIR domain-containing protein [Rhodospirillales bacterium]|jgi:hypothetical protein